MQNEHTHVPDGEHALLEVAHELTGDVALEWATGLAGKVGEVLTQHQRGDEVMRAQRVRFR